MKRWIHDESDRRFKWSNSQIDAINELLSHYNKQIPSEIHRRIRTLKYFNHWKGTEFRTFLLYVGIVVLKDFLSPELYEHFLQLYCAVSICYCNAYSKYQSIAKELFEDYIENYIDIYGIGEITSNVHNLCHVIDDVKRFGSLSKISTYEFENSLGQIKNQLRRCDKPLEQIARRVSESMYIKKQNWYDQCEITFQPFVQHSIGGTDRYKKISVKPNVVLNSRKFGDNFFLNHHNDIVEFDHAIRHNSTFLIYGSSLKNKGNFFTQPFSSSKINVFVSDLEKQNSKYHTVQSIKCKLVCLSYKHDYVLMPLLHSLD